MLSRLLGKTRFARCAAVLLLASIALLAGTITADENDWAQWGGPNRNFKSASKGLASSWTGKGPRELWSRELGEGHSFDTG